MNEECDLFALYCNSVDGSVCGGERIVEKITFDACVYNGQLTL